MQRMPEIAILRNFSSVVGRLLLALLTFGFLARASDEPWKGKPYDQWTSKDLERIFTDSPWSRTATIVRTWVPLSAKDFPTGPVGGSASKGQPNSPRTLEKSDNDRVALNAAAGGLMGDEVNFNIYWASSRVMRAASARKAVLHGPKKDLDVEKYANEPQEEYQIVVQSKDMAPFVRKDEKFYQANAYLEVRKTKQKISPNHVRYERDEKGLLVTAAVFFFPKETPSGDPTITPDEKSVEFNCKIEGSALRVNFEPQKMVDNNGPAL